MKHLLLFLSLFACLACKQETDETGDLWYFKDDTVYVNNLHCAMQFIDDSIIIIVDPKGMNSLVYDSLIPNTGGRYYYSIDNRPYAVVFHHKGRHDTVCCPCYVDAKDYGFSGDTFETVHPTYPYNCKQIEEVFYVDSDSLIQYINP